MSYKSLKILGIALLVFVPVIAWLLTGNDDAQMMQTADKPMVIIRDTVPQSASTATFAGGCFWCTEAVFQETPGVLAAISGYAGGTEYNPTYEQVYREQTSHRESVRVYYDPVVISYDELLDIYWHSIDPTDSGGQFVDRGMSYTTAIFYENDVQRESAQASKSNLEDSGRFDKPIVTQILPFSTFYEAEDYHQDFYKKSTDRYESYKNASGREEFKALIWQEIQKDSN